MNDVLRCSWCYRRFRPRQGGRAQRFCRPSCRRAFHAAVRAWALDAIAGGTLTVADIRYGPAATRALLPAVVDGIGQHTHDSIRLSLEILRHAVGDLIALGWLPATDRGDKDAMSGALLQLVRAAIGLRVTPSMGSQRAICFLCEIPRSTIETLVEIDWLRVDQRDDHAAVVKTFRRFVRRALAVARNECAEPY